MSNIFYRHWPYPVRDDLVAAHRRAWRSLAHPGTWLSGPERVAIMAETRHAAGCALCKQRKDALSPYAVSGEHDSLDELPQTIVEIIHRITSDPARLAKHWFDSVIDAGISDTDYVEIVGVVSRTVAIDTFTRGIGAEALPLPEPVAGEPSRKRPAAARLDRSWVATIAPEDIAAEDADIYPNGIAAHIYRAMSLVPSEVRGFFDLVSAQYLPQKAMREFGREFRAITHAQIELVAGRISALNQCVY